MSDAAGKDAEKPDVGVEQAAGKEGYTFRFVEVGEPSQDRDEDARSIIRSHVMRDFYEKRDRRRRPSTLPVLSSAAPKEVVSSQTHRFKVGPQGLQEMKKRRRKSDNVPGRSPSVVTNNLAAKVPAAQSIASYTWHQAESESLNGSRGPQFNAQRVEPPTGKTPQTSFSPQSTLQPGRQTVGSGVADPFNTLPPSASPRTQHLLYYADRGVLSSRLMGQLRTEWLSLATQDTALFHVALSHYAGNYGLARRENDPVEALRFRMEAMRIVNKRLEHVDSALTDGTLGTVASLSSYEATNGSLVAIETHLNGLQRIVSLRGGLALNNLNQFTRRLVLWADLNCANALGRNPIFPILETDECAPGITWFDTIGTANERWPSMMICGETAPGGGDLQVMTKELKDDFTILKNFSELGPPNRAKNEDAKKVQIGNSDTLYFTERSLLTLSNSWGPSKFATSGCLAAIIFLDNYFRGIAFHARIMDRMVARLQFSMNMVLSDISRHNANEGSAKAMLWVLFVGAVAAGVRPERDWFMSQLLGFIDALDLQIWEQTELVLKGFLWPSAWEVTGRTLWIQLEEARTAKSMIWPLSVDLEPLGHYQWSLNADTGCSGP